MAQETQTKIDPESVAIELVRNQFPPTEIKDRTGLSLERILELRALYSSHRTEELSPEAKAELLQVYDGLVRDFMSARGLVTQGMLKFIPTISGSESDVDYAKTVKDIVVSVERMAKGAKEDALGAENQLLDIQGQVGEIIPRPKAEVKEIDEEV